MKCAICNNKFNYENIIEIVKVQEICNKCSKLFYYGKKNVKIERVMIRIRYFLFYENIQLFINEEIKGNVNKYIIQKKVNGEFYDLKVISNNSVWKDKNKLRIVYYRNEFVELKRVLQMLINSNEKVKIECYELLCVNTKKTQTNESTVL